MTSVSIAKVFTTTVSRIRTGARDRSTRDPTPYQWTLPITGVRRRASPQLPALVPSVRGRWSQHMGKTAHSAYAFGSAETGRNRGYT
jgi:hypothetical protein